MTWEQISQAAEYFEKHKPAATSSNAGFGSDGSGSDQVFSDAVAYQTPESDGSIERSLIPDGLFAHGRDDSSALDKAVKGIRRGRGEMTAAGLNGTSAAADLASQMGLAVETSRPDVSHLSPTPAVQSVVTDLPRPHVREALYQMSDAASEAASDIAGQLPDRRQLNDWGDQISHAPSAVEDYAKDTAQSTKSRADSMIDDTRSVMDDHLVEPVKVHVIKPVTDTATDATHQVKSHIPDPSTAADAVSATVSDLAHHIRDRAQSALDDVSHAVDRGVETLHRGADEAKSSMGSAFDSLPSPTEIAKGVSNSQASSVKTIAESATEPTITVRNLTTHTNLNDPDVSPYRDRSITASPIEKAASASPTDSPSQSVFESWGSDDEPVQAAAQAGEAMSTFGDRFKGKLQDFGADLGRMREQTSAAARSGYNNTTAALQRRYNNTASTLGGWYRGTADTASRWTSRVGDAFKKATSTIDSELSEPPRPVISAPVSVKTTVDPFADVEILNPHNLDKGLAVASIPSHRTDLTNGGWVKSLWSKFGSSKAPTTSVADSELFLESNRGVSASPTSAAVPGPTTLANSRRGWFGRSKQSADRSMLASSIPSKSARTSRRKSSVVSKYGREPSWLESALGLGPGKESAFWRKVDGRASTRTSL